MPSDNPFSVTLPPVQWTSGAPTRDSASDSLQSGERKKRKAGEGLAKPAARRESAPFEEAAPHEVDSFA